MHDDDIPPAEAAEFSRAFDLYVRLDEVKAQADAARLRLMDADRRTSALECEARERLVEATDAKVANIEAELEALKASHQGQDAEPRADEAQPVAAPLSRHAHQESEILRVLRELGYDPQRLPRAPAGTPGPKAEVRKRLPDMSASVFKKAWDRLRGFGDIQDAD